MNSLENGIDPVCDNTDDGHLVFAPRETLTDEEKEIADFHFERCEACQLDMDVDYFLSRIFQQND